MCAYVRACVHVCVWLGGGDICIDIGGIDEYCHVVLILIFPKPCKHSVGEVSPCGLLHFARTFFWYPI